MYFKYALGLFFHTKIVWLFFLDIRRLALIITPQNELDAVNEILSSIGSSPVSSLEDENNVDVINAKRILKGVSKEIQARGWFFNTLEMIHLDPEDNRYGKLNVPCPNSYLRFEAPTYKLIR